MSHAGTSPLTALQPQAPDGGALTACSSNRRSRTTESQAASVFPPTGALSQRCPISNPRAHGNTPGHLKTTGTACINNLKKKKAPAQLVSPGGHLNTTPGAPPRALPGAGNLFPSVKEVGTLVGALPPGLHYILLAVGQPPLSCGGQRISYRHQELGGHGLRLRKRPCAGTLPLADRAASENRGMELRVVAPPDQGLCRADCPPLRLELGRAIETPSFNWRRLGARQGNQVGVEFQPYKDQGVHLSAGDRIFI